MFVFPNGRVERLNVDGSPWSFSLGRKDCGDTLHIPAEKVSREQLLVRRCASSGAEVVSKGQNPTLVVKGENGKRHVLLRGQKVELQSGDKVWQVWEHRIRCRCELSSLLISDAALF
jgi:hypothetical protein